MEAKNTVEKTRKIKTQKGKILVLQNNLVNKIILMNKIMTTSE